MISDMCTRAMKEVREEAMHISEGKAFKEKRDNVSGRARKPVWLQGTEEESRRK